MEMIMNVIVIMSAIFFMVLMFMSDELRGFYALFSSVLWFISAAGISIIHRPYTYVSENASGGEKIVSGVQKVTSNWPMTTLFIGLGLLCLFMFFMHYADEIKEKLSKDGYGSIFEKEGY